MRERQVAEMLEPETVSHDPWDDRLQLLEDELSRLPDRYRLPMILCELEGKTHQEAADQAAAGRSVRFLRTVVTGEDELGERLSREDRTLSSASLPALFVPRFRAGEPVVFARRRRPLKPRVTSVQGHSRLA